MSDQHPPRYHFVQMFFRISVTAEQLVNITSFSALLKFAMLLFSFTVIYTSHRIPHFSFLHTNASISPYISVSDLHNITTVCFSCPTAPLPKPALHTARVEAPIKVRAIRHRALLARAHTPDRAEEPLIDGVGRTRPCERRITHATTIKLCHESTRAIRSILLMTLVIHVNHLGHSFRTAIPTFIHTTLLRILPTHHVTLVPTPHLAQPPR